MFRQSPRRSQRNKGFKVKHVLQICVLLAVSVWLVYQAQQSRNKKAAIEESNQVSERIRNGDDILVKLGRKDLQPRVEGSTVKDVRPKEDQEEESREKLGEEGEHEKDFVDEESEIEAQKEAIDERKDPNVGEQKKDENVEKEREEENSDGNQELDVIGVEDFKGKEESKEKERKVNASEAIGDGQIKGRKEAQENISEVVSINGETKANVNEGTEGKSSDASNFQEKGEIKGDKEEEGKSKEITDEKVEEEKVIESKATESEETVEINNDQYTNKDREEKEGMVEDSGTQKNKIPDTNYGEAARDENHESEKHLSSIVDQGAPNISETEEGIMEKPKVGEQIESTDMKRSNMHQYNSGLNVTDNALDSLGHKNGTGVLKTEDSSNQTTATTETGGNLNVNGDLTYFDEGEPPSSPTSATELKQNKTVDHILPFEESMQKLLQEKPNESEEMPSGENLDMISVPPAIAEKKDVINGTSIESFDNIEFVVLNEQTVSPLTSNKTDNSSENSTRNDVNDTLQSQEIAGTEEHRDLSNGNANADSGQNKIDDLSTSSTLVEKEASSSPNHNADEGNHDKVNSNASSILQDEKQAPVDLATLPERGPGGRKHEVAARK